MRGDLLLARIQHIQVEPEVGRGLLLATEELGPASLGQLLPVFPQAHVLRSRRRGDVAHLQPLDVGLACFRGRDVQREVGGLERLNHEDLLPTSFRQARFELLQALHHHDRLLVLAMLLDVCGARLPEALHRLGHDLFLRSRVDASFRNLDEEVPDVQPATLGRRQGLLPRCGRPVRLAEAARQAAVAGPHCGTQRLDSCLALPVGVDIVAWARGERRLRLRRRCRRGPGRRCGSRSRRLCLRRGGRRRCSWCCSLWRRLCRWLDRRCRRHSRRLAVLVILPRRQ
mmetsp:Transcript_61037/g.176777  ORF Transcript_61037/g.176777 Transcript_61037/m.176777 type:complete len:285 (+) Transcript_61037:2667-3521(+)